MAATGPTTAPSELTAAGQKHAEVLRKHIDTVHSSSPMTLKERQCANALLVNAMAEGVESLRSSRQFEIRVADLCDEVYGQRQNRIKIRKTLDGLLNKKVTWQYTTEKSRRSVGASTWLAGYDMDEHGVLRYSYSAEIVDKILEPRLYARLNYSIQHLIRRSHTQTLYENCARYRDLGRTKTWTLPIFRGLMGIMEKKTYTEFKELNRAVIKPAVKEINQKTEIFIEPNFLKKGSEVVSVFFSIVENTDYSGPNIPTVVPLSPNFDTDLLETRSEMYEILLGYGLDHQRVIDMLEKYDDAYIQANLKIVNQRLHTGGDEIKNPAGYVINALRKNFSEDAVAQPSQRSMDLESAEEKKQREQDEQAADAAGQLTAFETIELPRWRANQWTEQQSEEQIGVMHEAFIEQTLDQNAFLRQIYQKNKNSEWLAGLWRKWVRDTQLDEASEEERQACAKELGFDLNSAREAAGEASGA